MDRKNISGVVTDDEAVSPVIGVILMVAVTVILAAAIGAFVLDFVQQPSTEPAPNAKFDVNWGTDSSTETVELTMRGGDTLETKYLSVQLAGTTVWTYADGAKNGMSIYASQNWSESELQAQDVLGLEGSMSSDDTLYVVWTRDDRSQILKKSVRE